MKLAALALLTTLGLGGAALADPARVDPPARSHGALHQLLLERFDRNHDGRLEPRERRRAIRALRRMANRMELRERRLELRSHRQQRFDRNDDGVVGPGEVPPGMTRRLRPLDRDEDGRLDDRDDQR